MEFEEITRKIIGCAYKVYNTMGFGFLESVYQKCLLLELKRSGLVAVEELPIMVYYDG
jgi:GxxExxY protein